MKNGTDEAINRIFELGRHINDVGVYDELQTLLDIDEFTNYMAVTMFLDNDDWPNNNMKAYRSQNDGRYRFVSFDLDYAFALRGFNKDNDDPFKYFLRFKDADRVYDEGNQNREVVRLFLNLLQHDAYRRKFIDTFCLVAGSVFEPTRAGKIVDELLNAVKPMTDLMKQQGINDGHDPKRAADEIKNKLSGRTNKMATNLQNFSDAKLTGAKKQTVKLNANVEGAKLFVNGIQVPYTEFNGKLFAPVTLEAKAPAGYKFEGWKSGGETLSTDATYNMSDATNVSLTASFVALSDDERQQQGITPVRINEVSASNGIHVNDYFKRNDWVEFYNTTSEPIDVEGMYLTDNVKKPQKYQITKGDGQVSTIIPAHGYLVVWCDKLDPLDQLHASFKLAAEGGDIMLTAEDGSWADQLTYTEHKADQTVGRYPDGGAEVFVMNVPTIAQANLTSSYVTAVDQSGSVGIKEAKRQSSLSARYVLGSLIVRGNSDGSVKADIYNMAGQSVASHAATMQSGYAELPVGQLPTGIYVAHVTDSQGNSVTCKFVKK